MTTTNPTQGSHKSANGLSGINWTPTSVIALVIVVLAALIGLIVFLAEHYHSSSDVNAVLGGITSVFTAAIGLAVGHTAGNLKGKATGSAAINKLKAMKPDINKLNEHARPTIAKVRNAVPGPNVIELYDEKTNVGGVETAAIHPDDISQIDESIIRLKAILDA